MNFALANNRFTAGTSLRAVRAALTLVVAIMFPVGIIGMAMGMFARQHQWMTSLYLGLEALLTFVLLWSASTLGRTVALTVAIGAAATIVEFIGLATGFPFGTYYYSYHLEPFIVSNVPWAIVFSWYILVVNTVLLFPSGPRSTAAGAIKIIAGGVLILGIDILLEPFASFVNRYWTWQGGVVPLQNYAAWFVIGTGLVGLTYRVLVRRNEEAIAADVRIPALLLGMTVLQCVVINCLNGHWLPTAAGAALVIAAYGSIRHGTV